MSDTVFQVEPSSNKTEFHLDVFYKLVNDTNSSQETHIKRINLIESDLEDLTPENFEEKTKLGFDIRNASQVRYFLSTVYYIKAKAEGLILMSFDFEDTLTCESWTLEVGYKFDMASGVSVIKAAEYNTIPCKEHWKKAVGFNVASEDKPIRKSVDFSKQQETYFVNFISLFSNLLTYYFVVSLLVNNSKYYKLEKQKVVKKRWIELRKNVENYTNVQQWEKPREVLQIPETVKTASYITIANLLLIISNTMMLVANIFVLLELVPFKLASSSTIEHYIRRFLGVGCFFSWLNIGTLLAALPQFKVVSLFLSGISDNPEINPGSDVPASWCDSSVLRFSVWRLLHVS